ncbi:MAG TPA: RNA methyltransferase [candidate division Zixibacteria bacterium]|nr:RNA methyltransferase [candidate division Zixibacteria bacterium]
MSEQAELENVCVVLVSPRNPLNIGAVARAMSNFGFSDMRVVAPYELSFREAQSAVNAQEILAAARVFETLADAVADCALVVGTTVGRARDLQQAIHPLQKGTTLIRKQAQRKRVALLFGSEKRGLSNDDFAYCNWLMRIPTRNSHPSMNLGQAVAVCLWEIARAVAKAQTQYAGQSPAEAGEYQRITSVLTELLAESGYINPKAQTSTELKIRRLVRRAQMDSEDAQMWLGMLRQILWKVHSSKTGR